jgi:hypothetical protein
VFEILILVGFIIDMCKALFQSPNHFCQQHSFQTKLHQVNHFIKYIRHRISSEKMEITKITICLSNSVRKETQFFSLGFCILNLSGLYFVLLWFVFKFLKYTLGTIFSNLVKEESKSV